MTKQICINVTDEMHDILSRMAEDQYRKLENLIAVLILEGYKFYVFDHEIHIKKKPEECDPGVKSEYQCFTNEEIQEIIKNLHTIN